MIASRMNLIGKSVASYQIEKLLGQGGMGTVYLARHKDLDKLVALKALASDLVGDEDAVKRFVQEARAAAKLEHPNIVQVYDAGRNDEICFYVMQYIDGKNLEQIMKARTRIGVKDATAIVKKIASALSHAHKLGIVHRDIKPANIMISKEGLVKISDFGLSKILNSNMSLSQTGEIMGTPYFMSPEQAKGEKVDGRSDIYSLGATYYYLLTGKRVFDGDTPLSIVMKHINEPMKSPRELSPDIPEQVSKIVEKMMAKKSEERYQNMDALIADIDALSYGTTIGTSIKESAPTALTAIPRRVSFRESLVAVAVVVVAVVVTVILLFPGAKSDVASERDSAKASSLPHTNATPVVASKTPAPDKEADKKSPPDEAGIKKNDPNIIKLAAIVRIGKRNEEFWSAIKEGKIERAVKFFDPRFVEQRGEEKIKSHIKEVINDLRQRGATFESAVVKDIDFDLFTMDAKTKTVLTFKKERSNDTYTEERKIVWKIFERQWYILGGLK